MTPARKEEKAARKSSRFMHRGPARRARTMSAGSPIGQSTTPIAQKVQIRLYLQGGRE
jgi:hypothetical protein